MTDTKPALRRFVGERPPAGDTRRAIQKGPVTGQRWMLLGGRGSGKTFAGNHWLIDQAEDQLDRLALIPTNVTTKMPVFAIWGHDFDRVRLNNVEGPAGLLQVGYDRGHRMDYDYPRGIVTIDGQVSVFMQGPRSSGPGYFEAQVVSELFTRPDNRADYLARRLYGTNGGGKIMVESTPPPQDDVIGNKLIASAWVNLDFFLSRANAQRNGSLSQDWHDAMERHLAGTKSYDSEVLGKWTGADLEEGKDDVRKPRR